MSILKIKNDMSVKLSKGINTLTHTRLQEHLIYIYVLISVPEIVPQISHYGLSSKVYVRGEMAHRIIQ